MKKLEKASSNADIDQSLSKIAKITYKEFDTIGISLGGVKSFRLRDQNVQAIVCSANEFEEMESEQVNLSCTSTGLTNDQVGNLPVGNKIKVWCPPGCLNVDGPVVGTVDSGYHFKSSVCRAGIHSGTLPNDGGYVNITIIKSEKDYNGKKENDIPSEGQPKSQKAIIFEKANNECMGNMDDDEKEELIKKNPDAREKPKKAKKKMKKPKGDGKPPKQKCFIETIEKITNKSKF